MVNNLSGSEVSGSSKDRFKLSNLSELHRALSKSMDVLEGIAIP